MTGHEPKTPECECCGWETADLEEVDCYARISGLGPFSPDDEKVFAWMCRVCRSTAAGRAYQFPDHYPNADVLQMIAWSTNRIMDDVRTYR